MKTENLIPASEFCLNHGIEFSLIDSLRGFDLIDIITIDKAPYLNLNQLPKLEQIVHFHKELKINLEGIDVIINLLERVNHIESEMNHLKDRLRTYESL